MTAKRLLGDTRHFCPVVLKENNVLQPCTEEIAAKYREKTFFFSSVEARDTFIENPEEFVAQTGPLKVKTVITREREHRNEKIILKGLFSLIQATSHAFFLFWSPRVREDNSW